MSILREDLPVGDNIVLNFLPPYDTILSDKTIYTIASLSTLISLVEKNLEPKENIYDLYGISDAYDTDLANNVYIVELSLEDKKHYVPINKIASKVTTVYIPYSERLIGIKLGAIPASEDLSLAMEDIRLFIEARLGIEAIVDDVEATSRVALDENIHIDREAERQLLKTQPGNYFTLYYNLKAVEQQLMTKLKSLERTYLNDGM